MYLLLFGYITKIMSQGLHSVEEFLKSVDKVKHAYKQITLKIIRDSGIDITFEMLEVMRVLWREDGVNQQVIANATLKDKVSLTYLIDHLTKRNWVIRVPGEVDRRSKLIHLTDEGKALKAVFNPELELIQEKLAIRYPTENLTEITEELTQIDEILKTLNLE